MSSGRLARLLAAACLALAMAPSRADADDKAPIITVIAGPSDRFGQRVIAELSSLGFDVIRADPPDAPASRETLEAAARRAGAAAAIRAVPSVRGVEVWITDRVTGKTVLREIAVDAGTPDPSAALAIRTVELLRASLLEIALPAPAPGDMPAPPAEVLDKLAVPAPRTMEMRPPPTLRFSLAPGAIASPGGFAPAAALDLGLAWMPSEHVGAAIFAAIPLTRPRVEDDAGRADLSSLLFGGGMRFVFTDRDSAWAPSIDVGVAALSLALASTAKQSYTARGASAWTAAPYARLGLAYALTRSFRLRADLLAAVSGQSVTVRLAARHAATFARPLMIPSAGVDFGWF